MQMWIAGGVARLWRSQRTQMVGAVLSAVGVVALVASLAGCGATSAEPNLPASKLLVDVQVFDHETADHNPSDSTYLTITLSRTDPENGLNTLLVDGTDTTTLVCDGVTLQRASAGVFSGSVSPQAESYTCLYFWNQGQRQAALTIPVVFRGAPTIESPGSHASVRVPEQGDPGVTVTYAQADVTSASVTAIARDYNNRTASSSSTTDTGTATIDAATFPTVFSIGWGTLSITRSASRSDLSQLGSNSAFQSTSLKTYEQTQQIPVFWV